ncbi:MAG: DUF4835 family protein [Bacteroidales bacterium]
MRYIISIFLIFIATSVFGQELMISISINSRQLEGTDQRIFQTLQTAMGEFMNKKTWTNLKYKSQERIEGTMMITLTERVASDEYKGRINIILRRPVYKTNYNSVVLNWIDRDFQFKYIENQPLEFVEGTHTSNLTSTLAFYAYLFLGLDGDTFAKFGGTPYFEKANAIISAAQSAPEKGWKSFESQRNRYWLMENIMNGSYSAIREALYVYHRRGLDVMSDNLEMGRLAIMESLELLQRAQRSRPGLFLLQLIMEAKKEELVNVFSQASQMDKPKAVNILKELDPSQASTYDKILKSKDGI